MDSRPTTTGRFAGHHDRCDKGFGHGYLTTYDRLLVGVDVRAILEVGVMDGASLAMWTEVFPDATVVAAEIDEQRAIRARDMFPGVAVYHGDAYSAAGHDEIARRYPDGFDFIIDDGSHRFEDQVAFVERYTALLRPGGVLVVEDILPPRDGDAMTVAESIGWAVPDEHRARTYVVDCRWEGSPYADDLLVVVDRREDSHFGVLNL